MGRSKLWCVGGGRSVQSERAKMSEQPKEKSTKFLLKIKNKIVVHMIIIIVNKEREERNKEKYSSS